MADGTSLINLGELSKPATVLIEKISGAVGGIFQPWQMRRVGQAEADVARIQAATRIEVSDLEYRAIRRRLAEEAIKQQNIEGIVQKALPALKEDARPGDVQNDWFANFFDKYRLISDDEMQELWARVLAGEANAPGHFSKRTVNLLASFDKADAELFRGLCSFCWFVDDDFESLVFEFDSPIYTSGGISFGSLKHLEAVGLISFDAAMELHVGALAQLVRASYQDEFVIEFPGLTGNVLRVGYVLLTRAGRELATVSEPVKSVGFQDYVLGQWRDHGLTVRRREPTDVADGDASGRSSMGNVQGASGGSSARGLILTVPGTLAIHSDLAPIAFFNSAVRLSAVTAAVKRSPIGAGMVISLYTPTDSLMTLTIPAGSTSVSATPAQRKNRTHAG